MTVNYIDDKCDVCECVVWIQNPWYMEWNCDNKEWNLNWEHVFPKICEYKRSDIKEVDSTEFRVCISLLQQ